MKTLRTLVLVAAFANWVFAAPAAPPAGLDPHLDASLVPRSCAACHQGHGRSSSPMLPVEQKQLCLRCHGTLADAARQIGSGMLAAGAEPTLIGTALDLPVTHPIDDDAFSRWDSGAVTCTSCHSPHRATTEPAGAVPPGRRKMSPRNPKRFEYELCQSCHGAAGSGTRSLTDVSRLTSPSNRSYHPIEAPAINRSPSVKPELAGREVNCTDCHGNSKASGPRGPHGSAVANLLVEDYTTADGGGETAASYGLCYRCHERTAVLTGSAFPEHELHVVEERASCATCHSAHGSPGNRALIRFGEETSVSGVAPSPSTGRLSFLSTTAGSGTCYLSCHGEDHGPQSYGPAPPVPAGTLESLPGVTDPTGADPRSLPTPLRPGERRRPREIGEPPLRP